MFPAHPEQIDKKNTHHPKARSGLNVLGSIKRSWEVVEDEKRG